ncbi:hypothetical protein C7445_102112 [Alicyclobacillus sacchari]|uniref:Uncharacterized protein n=1 Tax=Alicyclobacillus sacchari TaxID=392010 RepID=A0A4R8LSD8_9BACL|nr:hypothetical protein [Alicyclobacillus sacchari]TDY50560.1 hypothetical protein C7445_102112 [Alicyclobacillus sacchari]GMA55514.1 hypothetical protein GCM10025858_00170 [Alicyclobacillus sacchari]GMA59110.1 hypothetical protein GCM10025858_36130 [Alicyclobacillus sacchari]
MSDKLNIPTFEVYTSYQEERFDGAIVAPDKLSYASDFPDIDKIMLAHQAILLYDNKWYYIPFHQIRSITKGKRRFALPWPLV